MLDPHKQRKKPKELNNFWIKNQRKRPSSKKVSPPVKAIVPSVV